MPVGMEESTRPETAERKHHDGQEEPALDLMERSYVGAKKRGD
jgi:hypothetical protein